MNEKIQEAADLIAREHRKIIDDWCKAYLAQMYEEGMEVKPGNFTLVEQQDLVLENGKLGKKYWFQPKTEESDNNEKMALKLIEELVLLKGYVEDQLEIVKKDYSEQFMCPLILNQILKMLSFVDGDN